MTLAERYGDTADRRRRVRWTVIGLAAVLVVAGAVWAFWSLFGTNGAQLSATDATSDVVDAGHVRVTIRVDAPAGTSVSCAVRAQNLDFTVVGYDVFTLPPSQETSRSVTRTLRTYEQAVSGSLDTCWVN